MEEEKKSKISNVEWGLVIGALLMIDLLQIGIDLIGIGLIVNRFLDIFVGMGFAFYLQMRGQSMASPKRLFSLLAVFGLEMIPVVDALPLWCLDGIFNMSMSKSDKILKNIPGGGVVSNALELTVNQENDNRSFSQKINDSTTQIREIERRVRERRNNLE